MSVASIGATQRDSSQPVSISVSTDSENASESEDDYDPEWQIKLERQHADLVYSMQGKLFQAPIRSPNQVLDVGCHLGVCTAHLGRVFPSAEVHGIDMCLGKFPLLTGEPTNVTLVQGNIHSMALTDECFGAASQDFIFSRLVAAAMENWKDYVEKAFQMLKPGGYLEVQEEGSDWLIDGKVISQSWQWWEVYNERLPDHMADYECATKAKSWMEEAGFENVEVRRYKRPWGDWLAKKECSTSAGFDISAAGEHLEFYVGALRERMEENSYSDERIAGLQAECSRTLKKKDEKYMEFLVTWGQKPLEITSHAPGGMGGS